MDSAATLGLSTATVVPPVERRTTSAAALAALGIVYGDLGTSPLYTYQTIVGAVGGHPSAEDALGSALAGGLGADHHRLGQILRLGDARRQSRRGRHPRPHVAGHQAAAARRRADLGLFGAALIYGDGIITPAISVLSALEGINVATDAFKPYVLPAALRDPARCCSALRRAARRVSVECSGR